MTREEEIKKEALKECSSFDLPDKEGKFKGVNSAYGLGFCEGAKWADEHPKKGLVRLDKVCTYLEMRLDEYIIRDFKKSNGGMI